MPRHDLPTGTVTFLFTDVEGSTKLLHELGAEAYADALADHRHTLRDVFTARGGVEVDTQGDAFFIAFPTAPAALDAAIAATHALRGGPIRVRMGLHTGAPLLGEEGYIGPDVHKGARIGAAGHGGQILLSSATAELVGDAGLRDLGLHRLKDLTAPERIFQADDGEHPPLKTLHQTNLPIPATPFLGRDQELAELTAYLADPRHRLVTLVGPGGTGKTRLALQAAAEVADHYPAGVWWVPLAPIRDPRRALEETGRALGATDDLATHIADRRLLLLLDNFEHLMDAATDLAPLLASCPNLTLLVTSREPLRLAGEQEFMVDPMRTDDAVDLFAARARAVRRDFAPDDAVRLICERLDNLPLAIELAAARVKLLGTAALLERLSQRLPILAGGSRDLPDRQRTLRATLEWSHELLDAAEKDLFARLGVFTGGCTLEAAEAVADADLDTLGSLVDKSLVRQREDRFWMLETIREFAVERLDASGGADALRERHAAYFLALAEETEPALMRDEPDAVARIEADHPNLQSALDHLAATSDIERLARLTTAIWRFWYRRSLLTEGRLRVGAVLDLEAISPALRAAALRAASVMELNLGEVDRARQLAIHALDLAREVGDRWGEAYATLMIGNCLSEAPDAQRDLVAARERLLEAAALFRAIGDRHYGLIAHHNQVWITGELGDGPAERRMQEEDLAVAREIGNANIEADCLAQLGMLARDDGDLEQALDLLRAALRIEVREALSAANHVSRIGSVLARGTDPGVGAQLIGAARRMLADAGATSAWWAARRDQETLELVRGAIGDEPTESALEAGRRMTAEAAIALAMGLDAESPGD